MYEHIENYNFSESPENSPYHIVKISSGYLRMMSKLRLNLWPATKRAPLYCVASVLAKMAVVLLI